MNIKLPFKGSEMRLFWKEDLYEGLLPIEDNLTTLMYGGKSFDIELGIEDLEKILFPESIAFEGMVDISSCITYVDGKPIIDKSVLQEVLSVDVTGDSYLETGTSLKDWNNPTIAYHFNSAAENPDWADLIDIVYQPNGVSFDLTFTQYEEEANGRCAVPYEFMEMVFEEFGFCEDTVNKEGNKIIYTFPISGFLVTRSRVIKLILEYTSRFHLCCGWDAAYYCPHHTEKWERV